ncbi:MAG: hypothetical protein ACI9YH_003733 [Colwellia sp.]|jgi:hypothetical protein
MNKALTAIIFSLKLSIIGVLVLDFIFLIMAVLWGAYRFFLVGVPWSNIEVFISKFSTFVLFFSAFVSLGVFTVILLYMIVNRYVKT